MTVGLLLVTHAGIATALVATADRMLGRRPLEIATLEVGEAADPEALAAEAERLRAGLDRGEGVLVLTDLYGATPSNVAARLAAARAVRVVAGVNLPMLVRVLNYPRLPLEELAQKALSGGRDGVLLCEPPEAAGG